MLDSTPSWVAVMTHHNAELLVAKRFKEANIEYYLPMLANKDRRCKANKLTEKPMFPCYIFARINNKRIYETRATTGVIYIVSTRHSIIRVPDSDIEAIRRFEATERKVRIRETKQLVKGASATILSGEFAGMTGVLIKGDKDGNFALNIEVMNMSFVVHVKRAELRPVEEQEEPAEDSK